MSLSATSAVFDSTRYKKSMMRRQSVSNANQKPKNLYPHHHLVLMAAASTNLALVVKNR